MVEHFVKILLIQRLVHMIIFNQGGGSALSAFM